MPLFNFPIEIKNLKPEDKDYPPLLRGTTGAPKTLYIIGNNSFEENCFAVVGTRRCSDYGKEIAYSISYELAKAGMTIVSGIARGIDTFSHRGALDAGGKTIAVLGTGLDKKSFYPKENLKLASMILEQNGSIISEYPVGTKGTQFTFPQRNRIISGISLGVLVVEAKIKSGALITAAWAKKQKKPVFAVPGPIFSQNSKGCHFLIKQGAKIAENAEDIIKGLGLKAAEIRQTALIDNDSNKEEMLILKALAEGSLHVDKISEKTDLPSAKISSILAIMEINGKVKEIGRNVYINCVKIKT